MEPREDAMEDPVEKVSRPLPPLLSLSVDGDDPENEEKSLSLEL